MTYISVKCPKCGCENVSKNDKTSYGKQQYICNNINCTKSGFILDFSYNASKPEVKSKISVMSINGYVAMVCNRPQNRTNTGIYIWKKERLCVFKTKEVVKTF